MRVESDEVPETSSLLFCAFAIAQVGTSTDTPYGAVVVDDITFNEWVNTGTTFWGSL